MKRGDTGRSSLVVSVIKAKKVVLSIDPRGDALLNFSTAGNAVVAILISMTALAELEAMLARARTDQAKSRPQH